MRRSGDILLWSLIVLAALGVLAASGFRISGGIVASFDGSVALIALVLLIGVHMPICVGFKRLEDRPRRPALAAGSVAVALVTCTTLIAFLLAMPLLMSSYEGMGIAFVLMCVIGVAMTVTSLAAMRLTAPRLRMEPVIRLIRLVAVILTIAAPLVLVAPAILYAVSENSLSDAVLSQVVIPTAILSLCAALLLGLASVALVRVAQPTLSRSRAAPIPAAFACPNCVANCAPGTSTAPRLDRRLHDATRCPTCGVATSVGIEGFRCPCGMNMAGLPGARCVGCAAPLTRAWEGPALASSMSAAPPRRSDRVHAWLALAVGALAIVTILGPPASSLREEILNNPSIKAVRRLDTSFTMFATVAVAALWGASLAAASAWRRGWHVRAALVQGMVMLVLARVVWERFTAQEDHPPWSELSDFMVMIDAIAAQYDRLTLISAVGIAGGGALALGRIHLRWPLSRLLRAVAILGLCLMALAANELPVALMSLGSAPSWPIPFADPLTIGTLSLLLVAIVVVLRRLEWRQERRRRGKPVDRGTVALPCPRCGVEARLPSRSGRGRCEGCRLEFSVSSWHAHCRCGYDLAGVTSPNCPECGHSVIPLARPTPAEPAAEIATNRHQ